MFGDAICIPSAMKNRKKRAEPKRSLKINQIIADMRINGRLSV
jgi:hypothetical protein